MWQALEMVQQRLLLREEAQLVPVVHRRDPRARGATPASLAARRVGGSCGPTWAIRGGTSGEGLASGYLKVMR